MVQSRRLDRRWTFDHPQGQVAACIAGQDAPGSPRTPAGSAPADLDAAAGSGVRGRLRVQHARPAVDFLFSVFLLRLYASSRCSATTAATTAASLSKLLLEEDPQARQRSSSSGNVSISSTHLLADAHDGVAGKGRAAPASLASTPVQVTAAIATPSSSARPSFSVGAGPSEAETAAAKQSGELDALHMLRSCLQAEAASRGGEAQVEGSEEEQGLGGVPRAPQPRAVSAPPSPARLR